MNAPRLFPRPALPALFALNGAAAAPAPSRTGSGAEASEDPDAAQPEPFALAPVPALANLLAELTNESERYLLAWQVSGRIDADALAAGQRMQLARDTVAELALWHGFGLELPARLRIVRGALDVRLDAIELHVESMQAFDERLAWFVVGRRVMPGGVRLRALESIRLDGACIWVLRTENGREHARPLRRVASVHVLRAPVERVSAEPPNPLASVEVAR